MSFLGEIVVYWTLSSIEFWEEMRFLYKNFMLGATIYCTLGEVFNVSYLVEIFVNGILSSTEFWKGNEVSIEKF